ncbi:hypothetical protein BDV23DRAFT_189464 [Aspergillus alliaceus]|uniref:Uncharacterized protein n=1 Tax=Petromyces alliaceus TaxID=209559 RepID=A0A5N7BQV0_PETAA|nr:hypothetical protein BDV23DRAFT_189464 [Aspergillus alliaceus]
MDGRYLQVLAEASTPTPSWPQSHPGLQRFWPGAPCGNGESDPSEPVGNTQQTSVDILDLVIASFDRVLNRALDTLASIHPPICRLFRSSSHTRLSAMELDRQQPITLQRYRRVWRRYLAWIVRGAPLTDQEQWDILGLRLDQYEREHVTRIWDTLQAYLAHPAETLAAGRFRQRMEETASRRQAVKRAYNRNHLGELAAMPSPGPTPQASVSAVAVRKHPRRENATPIPIPPLKQRRVASRAQVSTRTESSGARSHSPYVDGGVATRGNATCPSPRYEQLVAVCILITPPSSSPNIHVTPIR